MLAVHQSDEKIFPTRYRYANVLIVENSMRKDANYV